MAQGFLMILTLLTKHLVWGASIILVEHHRSSIAFTNELKHNQLHIAIFACLMIYLHHHDTNWLVKVPASWDGDTSTTPWDLLFSQGFPKENAEGSWKSFAKHSSTCMTRLAAIGWPVGDGRHHPQVQNFFTPASQSHDQLLEVKVYHLPAPSSNHHESSL